MTRPGVTYQNIATAAAELKGQGKSITIENIRKILGTGSIGTINKYLRQWRDIQSSVGTSTIQDSLPDEVISLIKGFWQGLSTHAKEQFDPVESQYKQEIDELKTELEKFRRSNHRWQIFYNQWQQNKAEAANEKLTLEQALQFSHKENESLHYQYDTLLKQLQEKEERITELNRLHMQTQANLEHFRESTREQRLLDQQQTEKEKNTLLFEIKELKEKSVLQQTKYNELHQQYQIQNQSHKTLENMHQQTLQSINTLKDALDKLKDENSKLNQTEKHLREDQKEIQIKFENKLAEFLLLQSEHKILNHQFTVIQKSIDDLKNQTVLLSSQNQELTQINNQLKGQLKQMQSLITLQKA